jgi:hypothetical protein
MWLIWATDKDVPGRSRNTARTGKLLSVAWNWFTLEATNSGTSRTSTRETNFIKQDPAIVAD